MTAHVVVLVGHGAPAADTPREWVSELKALEARRRRAGTPMTPEERALDTRVRAWPRTRENDPYRVGMERLAAAVARRLPAGARLVVAYNEFCAPAVDDAIREAARLGAERVDVVPSMLTPGGVHSEVEIPEVIDAMRKELPGLTISYAWPFDLDAIAELLVSRVRALQVQDPHG